MTALPLPAERVPVHTRTVRFDGFSRADGLWDIDAEIRDTKAYALRTYDGADLAPGDTVHHMAIRMTLDDSYMIRGLDAAILGAPFGECQAAVPPLAALVGVRLGGGWRKAIDAHLGGIKSCTHLRELLFNMATAAFQTIPHYQQHVRGITSASDGSAPTFMGRCISWDFDGAVVQRVAPEFFRHRRTAPSVNKDQT